MKDAEDRLASYLAFDVIPDKLFEIWHELGGIDENNSIGLAYYLVDEYGVEAIQKLILTGELTEDAISDNRKTRDEALATLYHMGYDLGGPKHVKLFCKRCGNKDHFKVTAKVSVTFSVEGGCDTLEYDLDDDWRDVASVSIVCGYCKHRGGIKEFNTGEEENGE